MGALSVPEELENHLIFALGDRDVRGGEIWFKNSQTERSRFL